MRQIQVLLNCLITTLVLAVANCSLSDKVWAQCWEQFPPGNDHKSQLAEIAPGLPCPFALRLTPGVFYHPSTLLQQGLQISHKPHLRTYIASVPCHNSTHEGYFMPLHYFSHGESARGPTGSIQAHSTEVSSLLHYPY